MDNLPNHGDYSTMSSPTDPPPKPARPDIPQGAASFDLANAVPVDPEETYQENDIFAFPDGVRFLLVEEVSASDGACCGPIVSAAFPLCGEGWMELTPEDMWAEQMRLVAGPSLPSSGKPN